MKLSKVLLAAALVVSASLFFACPSAVTNGATTDPTTNGSTVSLAGTSWKTTTATPAFGVQFITATTGKFGVFGSEAAMTYTADATATSGEISFGSPGSTVSHPFTISGTIMTFQSLKFTKQ